MIQIPLFTVLDSITFHAASCGIAVTTIGPPKPRTRYSLRILFLKATMLLTSVVAHVSVFSLRDDDILQSCRLFAMIGITFLNTSNIWWMYANWKIGMRTTVCKVALISCAWNVRYAFVLSDTLSIPYTVVEYLTIYSDVCIMTILSLAVVCTHLAMSPLSSSSSSSSSSSLPPHAENNKQTIQSNFKNLSSITTPKDALGALVVYLKLLNLEYLKKEITAPLLVMGVELLQAELNIILAKLVPQTKFVLHSKLNVTLGNSNKLLIASDSISFEFMGSKEEAKMLTLGKCRFTENIPAAVRSSIQSAYCRS
ncbi:hypothetical protein BDR26DRAFT_861907 [Obelidium mucronatum]|nr:hypothetical protein BDR26DRAFT_861907 [Obelidium mucronatum]